MVSQGKTLLLFFVLFCFVFATTPKKTLKMIYTDEFCFEKKKRLCILLSVNIPHIYKEHREIQLNIIKEPLTIDIEFL